MRVISILFRVCLSVCLSLLLFSCETNQNVVHPKKLSVTDFTDLYGLSKDEIESNLAKFYIIKDRYDDYGNLYWVISNKMSTIYVELETYEYFVTVTFSGSVCNEVSLLNTESSHDYASLANLKKKYGKCNEISDDFYTWSLYDSEVSYFGSTDKLLISRTTKDNQYSPAKLQKIVLQRKTNQ